MIQPRFQGLHITGRAGGSIAWDAKGPKRDAAYELNFHDSLHPEQSARDEDKPIGIDEIRLSVPFDENGLRGTEVLTLRSKALGEAAGTMTSQALRSDVKLREQFAEDHFFTKSVSDETCFEVDSEPVAEQVARDKTRLLRAILDGGDVKLIHAKRIIDPERSSLSVAPGVYDFTQPMSLAKGRAQWQEHKTKLLQVLDRALESGSASLKGKPFTVNEGKKRFLIFGTRKDSHINISNTLSLKGLVNAFTGVYTARK